MGMVVLTIFFETFQQECFSEESQRKQAMCILAIMTPEIRKTVRPMWGSNPRPWD